MTKHLHKRAILSLIDNKTGKPANFEIIVYGRSVSEMQVTPNEVAAALAEKYPTVTGSLFATRAVPTIIKRKKS